MYDPPPAERPAMPCPKCGHNVAERWSSTLKSCPACGVELELEANPPCLVVVGMMAVFLFMGMVLAILVELARRSPGGLVLPIAGGLVMFALYGWLLIKLTHRWSRLKVKD